ncbi:hypothetical protein ACFE04_019558 [Oxalis oulophora]
MPYSKLPDITKQPHYTLSMATKMSCPGLHTILPLEYTPCLNYWLSFLGSLFPRTSSVLGFSFFETFPIFVTVENADIVLPDEENDVGEKQWTEFDCIRFQQRRKNGREVIRTMYFTKYRVVLAANENSSPFMKKSIQVPEVPLYVI